MKGKLTLQQRLNLPILLLGMVTLLSNILAVFSVNNVNANAGTIVDKYMVSETRLEEIRRSLMDLHRLALSHIVAADHSTMIQLVQQIKEEEAELDGQLEAYQPLVPQAEEETYQGLLTDYQEFKHSLVRLVCASADSKTQEAYAVANGDVAVYSTAVEGKIDSLYQAVSTQADTARNHLFVVYISSLLISAVTLTIGIFLVAAAFRMVKKYVISPIREVTATLQDSSQRIGGVVGDVRGRTQNSSASAQDLSSLTAQLSAAIEEIASSTSAIRSNASATQSDANTMAEECAAIAAYSIDMRGRAEKVEAGARTNMESVRSRTGEIMVKLNQAIEKSRSVDQINSLTKDILSISSSTDLIAVNASIEAARAGKAGEGFAVVAREVRALADSCAVTAGHIQEVSGVVTGAMEYLTGSAKELVEYLNNNVFGQFEQSVRSGQQYRDDAIYVEDSIEAFHSQVERLRVAMDEITGAISNISEAIDGAASGVNGAAGSTRSLVEDMEGITKEMSINQEIVGELQKQMETLANL